MRAQPRARRATARVEIALCGAVSSAAVARRATRRFLAGPHTPALAPDRIDDVMLVVSELVTNAIRYAPGPCRLRLDAGREAMTIEVRDSSAQHPAAPGPLPGADAENGRGLALIRHLARRLETTSAPDGGKTVLAVLAW